MSSPAGAAPRGPRVPRKIACAARELDLASLCVLDVGCGGGVYLEHFSAASLGIDRDPACVTALHARGLAAEVRDVEVAGWTVGLGRFDLVWLCDLLVHLRDPGRFLASCPDVLAPGGRLWISEWLWPESPALAGLVARLVPDGRTTWTHPEHLHHLTRRGLRAELGRTGFAVERELVHTFTSPALRALAGPFWPPRTVVATLRR